MPNWIDVKNEMSFDSYELVRKKYINILSEKTGRNVICYYSGWLQKTGNILGISDEDTNAFMTVIHGLDRTKGLDLILHTPGGDLNATEQIIKYLLKMFNNDIRAIIPQIAMSAGTLIASACKSIIMGKQSCLGPTDPSLGSISCQGVISEYEEAKEEVNKNPQSIIFWQHIISKYQPTIIGECRKAIALSKELMKEFLENNMLKDKKDIINQVVDIFSSHEDSKTHSRHFDIDFCKNTGLIIENLEDDDKFQDLVLTIHHSCMYTFGMTQAHKIVESQKNTFIYT